MKLISVRDLYPLSVIALAKTSGWLPSARLKKLILKSVAFAAYRCSRKKRQSIEKNLSRIFDGKLNDLQKREIVKGTFFHFWQGNFSDLSSRIARDELKRANLHGLEYLSQALENGRGVILWESNSLGRRALIKQVLYEHGLMIHQCHGERHFVGFLNRGRPATWVQDHIVKGVLERLEKQFVSEIIYLNSPDSLAFTRVLLHRLKQNAILCIQGDGQEGQKFISLRFLGSTNLFPTGMISLAKISGATILPVFCIQEKGGKFRVVIEGPIRIDRSMERARGLEHGLVQYAGLLESYAMRYPEQYLRWHFVGLDEDASVPVRAIGVTY